MIVIHCDIDGCSTTAECASVQQMPPLSWAVLRFMREAPAKMDPSHRGVVKMYKEAIKQMGEDSPMAGVIKKGIDEMSMALPPQLVPFVVHICPGCLAKIDVGTASVDGW